MSAKDIIVKPINQKDANKLVDRFHYSGSHVRNSSLHLGVFYKERLEGVMQYGPSMCKKNMIPLVKGTKWNGFLELNRMAFSDKLPRNSESRALAVSFRLIRQNYPHIKWIVSFADGTQCGDGTIYRASGFVLTGINKNKTLCYVPGHGVVSDISIKMNPKKYGLNAVAKGASSVSKFLKELGGHALPGYQLRYIYFLDPSYRKKLTVPEIPFSKIDELGAGMYKGEKREKQAMGGAPTTATVQRRSSRSTSGKK